MTVQGYTNSQSWEAWADSVKVLWDNTEMVFLTSVAVCIGAVVFTLMKYPKSDSGLSDNSLNDNKLRNEDEFDFKKYEYEEMDEESDEVPPLMPEYSPFLIKKQLTREIEERMSGEEKQKETKAKNEQLAVIFNLMKAQEDKFGETSMEDVVKQMNLYCS